MSHGIETVVIKSQKSCGSDSSPLRSVENQLDFTAVGTRGSSGRGGGSPRTPRPLGNKMNNSDSCHNNNINIVTNIRIEPFSDFYIVDDEIGRGKFAVVKRCRHRQNGKEYAAKFLRKRRKGKDCRSDVIQEIKMLEIVRKHPRLVHLVEVFETSHELIIITEYASGGELYQHVVVEERIAEKEVRRLMRQVLDGLLFLHDRNTVHLDVKPQNVLLTDRLPHGDIKLCDLGFARKVYSGEDVRDIIGTPDYVAPEVLSYEPIHTASDMWSVGVLAYVMLTGYSPFAGDTKQETFLNISQVNIDFPDDLFEDVSAMAQEFMMRLLVREPSERMTARDCLNHPWLRIDDSPALPRQVASPFGSPVGQRRALTPPAADATPGEEPLKKCRCDGGDAPPAPAKDPAADPDDTQQRHTGNKMAPDLLTTTSLLTTTATTATPHIMEDNNNVVAPSSPTSGSGEQRTPVKASPAVTSETRVTSERSSLDDATSNCLPQVEVEQEIIC